MKRGPNSPLSPETEPEASMPRQEDVDESSAVPSVSSTPPARPFDDWNLQDILGDSSKNKSQIPDLVTNMFSIIPERKPVPSTTGAALTIETEPVAVLAIEGPSAPAPAIAGPSTAGPSTAAPAIAALEYQVVVEHSPRRGYRTHVLTEGGTQTVGGHNSESRKDSTHSRTDPPRTQPSGSREEPPPEIPWRADDELARQAASTSGSAPTHTPELVNYGFGAPSYMNMLLTFRISEAKSHITTREKLKHLTPIHMEKNHAVLSAARAKESPPRSLSVSPSKCYPETHTRYKCIKARRKKKTKPPTPITNTVTSASLGEAAYTQSNIPWESSSMEMDFVSSEPREYERISITPLPPRTGIPLPYLWNTPNDPRLIPDSPYAYLFSREFVNAEIPNEASDGSPKICVEPSTHSLFSTLYSTTTQSTSTSGRPASSYYRHVTQRDTDLTTSPTKMARKSLTDTITSASEAASAYSQCSPPYHQPTSSAALPPCVSSAAKSEARNIIQNTKRRPTTLSLEFPTHIKPMDLTTTPTITPPGQGIPSPRRALKRGSPSSSPSHVSIVPPFSSPSSTTTHAPIIPPIGSPPYMRDITKKLSLINSPTSPTAQPPQTSPPSQTPPPTETTTPPPPPPAQTTPPPKPKLRYNPTLTVDDIAPYLAAHPFPPSPPRSPPYDPAYELEEISSDDLTDMIIRGILDIKEEETTYVIPMKPPKERVRTRPVGVALSDVMVDKLDGCMSPYSDVFFDHYYGHTSAMDSMDSGSDDDANFKVPAPPRPRRMSVSPTSPPQVPHKIRHKVGIMTKTPPEPPEPSSNPSAGTPPLGTPPQYQHIGGNPPRNYPPRPADIRPEIPLGTPPQSEHAVGNPPRNYPARPADIRPETPLSTPPQSEHAVGNPPENYPARPADIRPGTPLGTPPQSEHAVGNPPRNYPGLPADIRPGIPFGIPPQSEHAVGNPPRNAPPADTPSETEPSIDPALP